MTVLLVGFFGSLKDYNIARRLRAKMARVPADDIPMRSAFC